MPPQARRAREKAIFQAAAEEGQRRLKCFFKAKAEREAAQLKARLRRNAARAKQRRARELAAKQAMEKAAVRGSLRVLQVAKTHQPSWRVVLCPNHKHVGWLVLTLVACVFLCGVLTMTARSKAFGASREGEEGKNEDRV